MQELRQLTWWRPTAKGQRTNVVKKVGQHTVITVLIVAYPDQIHDFDTILIAYAQLRFTLNSLA